MKNRIFKEILDETPREVEVFIRLYAELVLRVNQILTEKGLTQRDLAARLGKTPSEINKWLKGEHNFTLRSIARLEAELGERLLQVPQARTYKTFESSAPLIARKKTRIRDDWKKGSVKETGNEEKPAIAA